MERKLVSLRNVDKIEPIFFLNNKQELEEASSIEKLTVGGWTLVVKKNVFNEDELFCYVEIDTILPVDIPLFAFLEGKRIRTKKLKGVVSQGVAFTIPEILEAAEQRAHSLDTGFAELSDYHEWLEHEWELGEDLTNIVGATKYDEYSNNGRKSDGVKLPPTNAKGKFPSFVPKTDEERIQNLAKELKYQWQGKEVVITEKLDGSSITIYCNKVENLIDEFGVLENAWQQGICSRNLDLKLITGNHFIDSGSPYLNALSDYCTQNNRSLALQGEIIGPGIQGNPYKLDKHEIYFFNVYDIDAGKRLLHEEAAEIIIMVLDGNTVPCLDYRLTLNHNMEQLLELADGLSTLNSKTNREGIVIRALDGGFSFKVISNKWLLKEKE